MQFKTTEELVASALYETSFHLPTECTIDGLTDFLSEHAKLMPGLLPTGPLIKAGKSSIADHNHIMVQYVFESLEKAQTYITTPSISDPVRNAFTATYGKMAQDRKRYLNGAELK